MLTYADAINKTLARDGRRVIAPWRVVVLLEQCRRQQPEETRRWRKPPQTERQAARLLKRLARDGAFAPIREAAGLYRTHSPFADRLGPIDERELLMELHPYAALSHFSAMAAHHLVEQTPRAIHLSEPSPLMKLHAPPPPGIDASEFELLPLVSLRRPKRLRGVDLRWHRLKPVRWFGVELIRPVGSWQIRCTDLERTLLDGVTAPRFCGGMPTVIEAWSEAADQLDVGRLCDYAERLGVDVVRRRVGLLLERLNLRDERLDGWATPAKGGSLKVDPAAPFTKTPYDERWCMSVNCNLTPLGDASSAGNGA